MHSPARWFLTGLLFLPPVVLPAEPGHIVAVPETLPGRNVTGHGQIFFSGKIREGALDLEKDQRLTLGQAIVLWGGLSPFSDSGQVRVIRAGSAALVVNVERIYSDGKGDVMLHPGDIIVVPEKIHKVSSPAK